MRHKARRDGISAQEVPAGLCAQQSLSPAGRRAVLALQSSLHRRGRTGAPAPGRSWHPQDPRAAALQEELCPQGWLRIPNPAFAELLSRHLCVATSTENTASPL